MKCSDKGSKYPIWYHEQTDVLQFMVQLNIVELQKVNDFASGAQQPFKPLSIQALSMLASTCVKE